MPLLLAVGVALVTQRGGSHDQTNPGPGSGPVAVAVLAPVPEVGVDGWLPAYTSASRMHAQGAARLQGQEPLDQGAPPTAVPTVQGGDTWAEARAAFVAGYRSANGPPQWETHFVEVVIPCEWSDPWGTPWYPGNGYLSVGQFHPDTWERAGGGDPNDLSTVGRNVANWLNLGVDPGGTGGWPNCFWK